LSGSRAKESTTAWKIPRAGVPDEGHCQEAAPPPRIWPSIVSAGWSDELEGARKFEAVGQQDDPRVAALGSAVDPLELIGIREVEARVRALAGRAKHALAAASYYKYINIYINLWPRDRRT
jgi:hypothetical protein